MPSAGERFRAKTTRRGDHEAWTGSKDRRGVGMVRIDGLCDPALKPCHRSAVEGLRLGEATQDYCFESPQASIVANVNDWGREPASPGSR